VIFGTKLDPFKTPSKSKDVEEALFYVQKTIENGWSRSSLSHHIETRFYAREGKAITNFEMRLPAPQSDLTQQLLKDPYNFDFLMLRKEDEYAFPYRRSQQRQRP
jgi:predicted nuclease of restriction endonuclease-like (RecB) superfamily